MALTNSERFGFIQWGSGSDVFTRDQLDQNFQKIEDKAAGYFVGTGSPISADAPVDGGSFYYDTATGLMWFFSGEDEASWRCVGRVTTGTMIGLQRVVNENLLEFHDTNGNVLMSIGPNGAMVVTALEDPVDLTLPAGVTASGGANALPAYTRSADGFIKLQGGINVPGPTITLSGLPRPRDLATHVWGVYCSTGGGAPVMATAALLGTSGTLQLQNLTGSTVWLDSVSYYAERV